jgi:DNA/RNA-binding domain of Phe-tRNA-synthetase-like protein
MQYPDKNLLEEFAKVKGSELNDLEKTLLVERQGYAEIWLANYAPAEYQLRPKAEMPEEAKILSEDQRAFLKQLQVLLAENKDLSPADLQQAIFDLSKDGIGPRKAFESIYLLLLGKKAGPRAGWLLRSVDSSLLEQRFLSLNKSNESNASSEEQKDLDTRLSSEVRSSFPGMFFVQVEIKNVSIKKQDNELEILKDQTIKDRSSLTVENIGGLPTISAYRKLFKATKTDFHKKRPSPEALLRRIVLGKDLYQINTAVDAYNLAVVETSVGLGGFDLNELSMPVSLKFSKAGEKMLLHGDSEETVLRDGQLVYADAQKLITIDLNYRDISETGIKESTKDILLCADGAPGLSEEEVINALTLGAKYIQQFCGGEIGKMEIIK